MRINAFITTFPGGFARDRIDSGGAERTVYRILNGLGLRGHNIQLFTTTLDNKNSDYCLGTINVHSFKVNLRIQSSRYSLDLLTKPMSFDSDIVFINYTVPSAFVAGYLYARKRNTPFIVVHHSELNPKIFTNPIYAGGVTISNIAYKHVLSRANAVVCPSNNFANRSSLLKNFLDKTVIIPNGVSYKDTQMIPSKDNCRKYLKIDNEQNMILFVGGLYYSKGIHVLLKAFSDVLKKFPNTSLFIVGEGENIAELIQLSENLQISHSVHFPGFIPHEDLQFYYAASDLFVLPSFSESFGNVILEAMSYKLPVIASNVGGIADIITNGENGLLIKPGDAEGISEKIIELLDNEDRRKQLSKNGIELVKLYSWDNAITKYEKLICSIKGDE